MSGVDFDSTTYVRPLVEADEAVTVRCLHPDEATAAAVAEGLEASTDSVSARAASSVDEALDGLGTDAVDCVVSAYAFPDTDGLAVLERVRAIDDGLPFVLLTDEGSERVAAAAVNAGADGYVTYEGEPDEATFAAVNDRLATAVDDYRTYRRLEETTDLLFRLTEYTNDALWMFSGDWSETVIINSAYEALWDRSVADLIDEPGDFLEGIRPEDRERVTEKMAVLSAGESADLEFQVRTDEGESGRWISVHAEPVFDDDGSVAYVAGFSRDVSELKQREVRLRDLAEATRQLPHARSEREVAEIVVDIVDSVIGCPVTAYWSYDADDERLEPIAASESALDVAGVSDTESLPAIEAGHDEMALYRAGEPTVVPEYDALSNPSAPGADLETLMLVPVGDRGLLNVGHPDSTEFDEFERTMVEMIEQATIDALERVEREAELERQRTELQRSNESLQQFAYVASHDLQEPLRMVSSYVSLLEEEYGDSFDEDGELYMEYAVDGATRMQAMIDALLQYSRVTTQGDELTETDAGAVFEETVRSLELLVEEREATVEGDDLPAVTVDREQLGQLFQNLVENALHYGGDQPTVTVDAEREDDRVHFTVADDGPGIEADQHDRIFEIFKQNSSRSESTGIGLAMCKRIVNRHGGEIWVESEPGDGAAFHFTMPAGDEAVQETHA
ncbi:ATP-binding protein [Halosimplex pelagicum]|uniref:histidine kinase n=1 Tax=Halosimplex pelagicum TaxID=869886 RepID=A0A7D5TEH2_9EURY|nr:ATP-binding protein [Halosimplex pelagicum]QLH83875.1 PAS domain-containing protein [Halosimplex pelagicum]